MSEGGGWEYARRKEELNVSALENRLRDAEEDEGATRSIAQEARKAFELERHIRDPDGKRQLPLQWGVAVAVALSVSDGIPAWWASSALGLGIAETWGMTLLLVVALAGLASALSSFGHDKNGIGVKSAIAGTVILVGCQSGLRAIYLTTMQEEGEAAGWEQWLLEVGMLAFVIVFLVSLSWLVLSKSEPIPTWQLRRKAERLADAASRAVARRVGLRAQLQDARSAVQRFGPPRSEFGS